MPLEQKEVKKALRNSIADGTASSVKSAITGTYTVPFALSLGASAGEIGILNSIPNLAATISQMFAGNFIKKMKGRKPVCNNLTLISRLVWIPIAFIPFLFTHNPIFWLLALLTVSQMTASLAVTAWSSWIGDLVPPKMLGRFFGKRNSIGGVASFLTTLGAGWLLTAVDGSFGFMTIFLVAVLFGLISNFYLSRIPEPKFHDHTRMRSPFKEFATEFKQNVNFKRFVTFIFAFYLAVYVAAPFFAVSMLRDFGLSYDVYALIMAVSILATIVSQPYWGRLADRFGDRAIMAVCVIFATLVPGLWLFVRGPIDIVVVQLFSAFGWAGLDLATFNYLLGVTSHKPSYIANYSMLSGIAIFVGPLVGGALAESGLVVAGLAGLSAVFFISFILRIVFSAILIPGLVEVRPAKWVPPTPVLLWKSVTIYPFRFFRHEFATAQHYVYHHRPRRGIVSTILRR